MQSLSFAAMLAAATQAGFLAVNQPTSWDQLAAVANLQNQRLLTSQPGLEDDYQGAVVGAAALTCWVVGPDIAVPLTLHCGYSEMAATALYNGKLYTWEIHSQQAAVPAELWAALQLSWWPAAE